ncbi:BZIP-type transcription factor MBZ1 [Psilocybe cubensis]|uniref:BZIP-type transcription factor MBZ1 n=2 Tax=Psilocybe cubensis TaxID=181762 RepID=A0ACB8GPA7_PSICU|nr:BZIP-type transcription factor MBZ1 [Psilocybe cubensis]KAH9477388.1 BZIP-type transcription factor MBZ1 [Psilocybe cubensis]
MLVDNPLFQPSYLAPGSSNMFPELTDISDIFEVDAFNNNFASFSAHSSSPSGSRGSTPQHLLTPPQEPPVASFPDVHDGDNSQSNGFNLFDDNDSKAIDPFMSTPIDFMGMGGFEYGGGVGNYNGLTLGGYSMPMDMSTMVGLPILPEETMQTRGIDPQLVDTPSAISDHGEDESDEKESPSSPPEEQKEQEKPTIVIAPVKVGGHGKARKGTVQSGGVVKKVASSSASKEKENSTSVSSAGSKKATQPKPAVASTSTSTSTLSKTSTPGPFLTTAGSVRAESEAGDAEDEDDLPQDWRPSPEVFAKMTSKEKRQLRNKISARNFRVRRKEYISTLEGDIAERDRMLDHFRTQLGSQESENLALRQEIAALKKALLEGRGGPINLPPPAPLPEQSAAQTLAASAAASASTSSSTSTSSVLTSRPSTPLVTANTQKDLPSSPRMGNRFWGGVGIGGGFTPVHTTLVPDISTVVRKGLQENMNPALNANPGLSGVGAGLGASKGLNGFDGFADLNPFTMKTLDAYRMHLWGKMAAQQHMHQQNQQAQQQQQNQHQQASGLAGSMRPHFFTPSSKSAAVSSPSLPSSSYGSTLSALLSGKHTSPASSYPSPPTSPLINGKVIASTSARDREAHQQREKEQQQAVLAAMASQTILRKLGSAFWDAFTGSSSSSLGSSSSSASSSGSSANWDADKVQRVLSGKAVLRVVDVEPATPPASPSLRAVSTTAASSPMLRAQQQQQDDAKKASCTACLTDILEESMRSLTLNKKM